jgi:hypothetical protein
MLVTRFLNLSEKGYSFTAAAADAVAFPDRSRQF